jgi:hypothetical protein
VALVSIIKDACPYSFCLFVYSQFELSMNGAVNDFFRLFGLMAPRDHAREIPVEIWAIHTRHALLCLRANYHLHQPRQVMAERDVVLGADVPISTSNQDATLQSVYRHVMRSQMSGQRGSR